MSGQAKHPSSPKKYPYILIKLWYHKVAAGIFLSVLCDFLNIPRPGPREDRPVSVAPCVTWKKSLPLEQTFWKWTVITVYIACNLKATNCTIISGRMANFTAWILPTVRQNKHQIASERLYRAGACLIYSQPGRT